MVRNTLIDFFFAGAESRYIAVSNYVTRSVKDVKGNHIYLNK